MEENNITISSSKSDRVSLEAIRVGEAGLNSHRQSLLDRVPNVSDWARFKREFIEIKDLAYLSAKTRDEFALLRGKKEDILYHGSSTKCCFESVLYDLLSEHRLELICHSHPGELMPMASDDDRQALKMIGQKSSVVISGVTGLTTTYSADRFSIDDYE